MSKSAIWMMPVSALLLAACSPTASVNDGAGYSLLTPNSASRATMLAEDRAFAEQVAAHNAQCRKDKGCTK